MVQESLQARTDEETPLLGPSGSAPTRAENNNGFSPIKDDDNEDEDTATAAAAAAAAKQPPRSLRWYVWRTACALLAAFVLGVFIKGWVDAGGDVQFNFKDALKRALGSGVSGAAAMVLQVLLLMPLRTIMNYQYRFGHSFTEATRILYRERGLGRYYDGLGAALIQGENHRLPVSTTILLNGQPMTSLTLPSPATLQAPSPASVTRRPTPAFWRCCTPTRT